MKMVLNKITAWWIRYTLKRISVAMTEEERFRELTVETLLKILEKDKAWKSVWRTVYHGR